MTPSLRPDILTATGAYFDFTAPDPTTITIESIAHALSQICRFGGHTREFYSVAQHCVLASYIVPVEDALWALLHDAAEAYIGDVVRPLKQLLPDYRSIEAGVERAVISRFGLDPEEKPRSVKTADLILLATEQRDLMPSHDDEWAAIADVVPLEAHIRPWSPATARAKYLARYELIRRDQIEADQLQYMGMVRCLRCGGEIR